MPTVLTYSVVVGTVWYLFGWQPAIPTFLLTFLFHKLIDYWS